MALRRFGTRGTASRCNVHLPLIVTGKKNERLSTRRHGSPDVLARLPDMPASRVHELLPWNWKKQSHRRGCVTTQLNKVHSVETIDRVAAEAGRNPSISSMNSPSNMETEDGRDLGLRPRR